MRNLKLISASAVLALGLGGFLATQAAAHTVPESVILNGLTPWTTAGGFTDGDSVLVPAGATITVMFESDVVHQHNWRSSEWDIGDLTMGCDDFTPNHDTNGSGLFTETFDITAPAISGTYDLDLITKSNDGCTGNSGPVTLTAAIIVAGFAIDIEKTLLEGPLDGAAMFMDEADDQPDQTLETGLNDAGAIWIGLDETQRYKFQIKITNNTGSTLDDTAASDVVPAEFNLDPALHEDDVDGGIDGTCPTDGVCNGDTNGSPASLELPGFVSDSGACVVTHSQPASADKPDPPEKQPEFFTILIDGLADEAMCTITIYVQTDENPGGGESPDFEPTSCRQIAIIDGIPINDTLTLNEGVKVFQIEPANSLPAHGERQFGPVGSLQLTVNGCDADGDGVQDLEDACPLEGPPDTGAGETLSADGCIIPPA